MRDQTKPWSLEQAVGMASGGGGTALLAGECHKRRSGKCSLGAWILEEACQVRMNGLCDKVLNHGEKRLGLDSDFE